MTPRTGQLQNRFPTTKWSLVIAAGNSRSDDVSDAALESLCALYWSPAYGFVRARGHRAEEALDLTQEFFVRVIEGGTLGRADESLGRFRTFLLTLLERFLINESKKKRAQKRGGGLSILQVSSSEMESRYQAIGRAADDPRLIYERGWAVTLLEHVLRRLEAEYTSRGRASEFATLRPFLTPRHFSASYDEAATRLDRSVETTRTSAYRLRIRYRQILMEELGETVDDPSDIEDEVRNLIRLFGSES